MRDGPGFSRASPGEFITEPVLTPAFRHGTTNSVTGVTVTRVTPRDSGPNAVCSKPHPDSHSAVPCVFVTCVVVVCVGCGVLCVCFWGFVCCVATRVGVGSGGACPWGPACGLGIPAVSVSSLRVEASGFVWDSLGGWCVVECLWWGWLAPETLWGARFSCGGVFVEGACWCGGLVGWVGSACVWLGW